MYSQQSLINFHRIHECKFSREYKGKNANGIPENDDVETKIEFLALSAQNTDLFLW